MTKNKEKEEKGKIQAVVPMPLQQRWEALQDSPKYRDKTKDKMVEDMVAACELAVFGAEHPAYEKQLEDLDKLWAAIRSFILRLIEDTANAEAAARKRVEKTLRLLEKEAQRIPELENSNKELFDNYYNAYRCNEKLVKALEAEKKHTAAAETKTLEAEAKATELQNRLNAANDALVKQMQEVLSKFASSSPAAGKAESLASPTTVSDVPPAPPAPGEAGPEVSA